MWARAWVTSLGVALGACSSPPPPAWTTEVQGTPNTPILLSVWGASEQDVWAVGGTCDPSGCRATSRSLVMHFDGSLWTPADAGVAAVLWWVFGFASNDVWFAGEQGTVVHWDGSRFTQVPTGLAPSTKLFGAWGSSPHDLWVVGGIPDASSVVLRFDGSSWSTDATAPPVGDAGGTGAWYKVSGSAADDVWLVGQRGTIAHWDGAAYRREDLSSAGVTSEGLFTVSGRARDDVYAVGGTTAHGLVLHFDGAAWSLAPGLDVSRLPLLTGVDQVPEGDVTITGLAGAKLRKDAAGWHDDSSVAPAVDLHAVWMPRPGSALAVGGNFFRLRGGVIARYGP